jgi:hypothetical protein
VDAVHRVVTDPGRLTESWYRSLLGDGVDPAGYVESVAVASFVTVVDTFAVAIGAVPAALPAPYAGEPSRQAPNARVHRHWVPTVDPSEATGEWEAFYDRSAFVPAVWRAASVAASDLATVELLNTVQYLPLGVVVDPSQRQEHLDRRQMELVAARVSALNRCFY